MIVFAAAAIGLAALLALWGARFDRNPLNLKDPTQESVSTAIDLLNNPRLRVSTVSILVDSVAEIAPLAEKLKKLPSVDTVRSIYDYVPRDQAAKLDVLEEIALQMTPILSPSERAAPPDAEQRAAAITALRDKVKAALDQKRAGALEADLKRLHGALEAFLKRGTEDLRTAALEQDLVGSLPKRLDALKTALAAKPVDFAPCPRASASASCRPPARCASRWCRRRTSATTARCAASSPRCSRWRRTRRAGPSSSCTPATRSCTPSPGLRSSPSC